MQDLDQREMEFQNTLTQLNYHVTFERTFVVLLFMINSYVIGTDTLAWLDEHRHT